MTAKTVGDTLADWADQQLHDDFVDHAHRIIRRYAAWAAARAAERKWQLQRLSFWMNEIEPSELPLPAPAGKVCG